MMDYNKFLIFVLLKCYYRFSFCRTFKVLWFGYFDYLLKLSSIGHLVEIL